MDITGLLYVVIIQIIVIFLLFGFIFNGYYGFKILSKRKNSDLYEICDRLKSYMEVKAKIWILIESPFMSYRNPTNLNVFTRMFKMFNTISCTGPLFLVSQQYPKLLNWSLAHEIAHIKYRDSMIINKLLHCSSSKVLKAVSVLIELRADVTGVKAARDTGLIVYSDLENIHKMLGENNPYFDGYPSNEDRIVFPEEYEEFCPELIDKIMMRICNELEINDPFAFSQEVIRIFTDIKFINVVKQMFKR
ncbi:hypothetical protein [Desulfosporosinus hippei]|uniref:Peptidase family M48 n=1 Tax=Desulfosporosinus hippei DSM 8344 TaxID=1121419 RepID=A0A1G8FMA9_9FIRM|nr:hypothetical protein [Desulfosporosinus hippei]SDH83258.1 hypothetical protein SAMN05443529_12014 [Desulfosporosinus hippei DSM 8344]